MLAIELDAVAVLCNAAIGELEIPISFVRTVALASVSQTPAWSEKLQTY